ncbi:hypothetical protein BCR39DRAFT_532469 [Naematelia encephala]|uniref:NEDD8-activating enzyme E1 regulatory subunit n=1 Tax=Naematelia encephala TaxID=71784 RepID=A0A1Y2B5H7_9TREE|nr:hypothetical protein BCR39DRAFT_532469 [Naematelia encephala]
MQPSPPSSPPNPRPLKLARMEDSIDIVQATTGTSSIPSYRPDAKQRRYDRQLRLWASSGQRSLESARVLLVGCDATGCQGLKNLVLPGIQQFTILSSAITQPKDVATNFFLHPDSVGQPIAQEAVRLLSELNPSVEGAARVDDISTLLQSEPFFFTSFTLVIATNVDPDVELALADLLWQASSEVGGPDIPLIAIRNSGFCGRVEIQLREHCVVDTHPDTTHTLRIDQPFPALEKHARELDLDSMDSMEFSHVPWVVLLVRASCWWKDNHEGRYPGQDKADDERSAERTAFKALLKAQKRKGDEENYDEALSQAYRAWTPSTVPYELQQLLETENGALVTQNSKNLHILLQALKLFLTEPPHLPPISPTLPDMHSSTTSYVALQNLYKAQYRADLEKFKGYLAQTLSSLGLPVDAIPDDEIEGFVKNSGGVNVIKGRALRESKEVQGGVRALIADSFSEGNAPYEIYLPLHLAFLSAERFFSQEKRWPGTSQDGDMAEDSRKMAETVRHIIRDAAQGFSGEIGDLATNAIAEVARGGFGTLPTTAAFLGGLVGQEAIKLVTNQYNPLDNTCIVDLVQSGIEKFRF